MGNRRVLNPVVYLVYTLTSPNSPELSKSLGFPSSRGAANTPFNLPPGLSPTLAGTTLHHACSVFDFTSAPGIPILCFVSNAVPIALVP